MLCLQDNYRISIPKLLKIQLWNGIRYDSVLDELNKRLEKIKLIYKYINILYIYKYVLKK